ncbi:uncharacterized protein LOC119670061 [Teleopsis dalmanni]|uniref:uncharacterized protein LOC119670061 n=1 Tax=Teleopsis dalmanni TaxID=139649 RepID=UPI000D32BFF8|nr:uncharacterized protein LOC119670061 [Teleopsis dalmanni]
MDSFNVPKKVNRHVLSALKFISRNKPYGYVIKTSDIIARVRHQMRSLIPVEDLPNVILKSLHNMENLRIVSKVGSNYTYCNPKQAAMTPIFPITADVSTQNRIVEENRDNITKPLEVNTPQQPSSASAEGLVLPDEREKGDVNALMSIDDKVDDNKESLECSNGEHVLKRKRNNKRKKKGTKTGRKNPKKIKSEHNLHDNELGKISDDIKCAERSNCAEEVPSTSHNVDEKIDLEMLITDDTEKFTDDLKPLTSSHLMEPVPSPSSDTLNKQMSFQKQSTTNQTDYKALNLDNKLVSANQSVYTDKNSKPVKVYHLKLQAAEKVENETENHECTAPLMVHDSSKIESTSPVASVAPNVLQRNLSTAEFADAIADLKEALINDYEKRHEEQ